MEQYCCINTDRVCGFASSVIILLRTLAVFSFFLKLVTGRDSRSLDLVKNCKYFWISPAIMHAIIIGCSGAIAMNLTQWRQQVIMIIVHKFSYLKSVELIDD